MFNHPVTGRDIATDFLIKLCLVLEHREPKRMSIPSPEDSFPLRICHVKLRRSENVFFVWPIAVALRFPDGITPKSRLPILQPTEVDLVVEQAKQMAKARMGCVA